MLAMIFPGQGAQFVGMGKDVWENFPYVAPLFQEAEEVFGRHLRQPLFHGPEEDLKDTRVAQGCLFVVSMAVLKVLEEEGGFSVSLGRGVAGHSLGEYSALCAAEVLSFSDTLSLLKHRCQAMGKVSGGGMVAVLGLTLEAVKTILQGLEPFQGVCQISNDNSPLQIVLSGDEGDLQRASAALSQGGARCVPLKVSGPFHSMLMKPAQEAFAGYVQEVQCANPLVPVYSNVSAKARLEGETLRQDLMVHMVSGVRWRETQLQLAQDGVTHMVELGGNGVLSALAKKTVPGVETTVLCSVDSLKAFLLSPWLKPSA